MKRTRPIYQNVVDLGLRDVGIKNEPRSFARQLGKALLALSAFVLLSAIVLCAILVGTDADVPVLLAFMLVWLVAAVFVIVRMVKQAPPVVVRVDSTGTNQAVWLLIGPVVLMVAQVALIGDPRLIPLAVLALIFAVVAWRGRGRFPDRLRLLREQLASNETVLGDGIGVAKGGRRGRDAFRVILATDRRVLLGTMSRTRERLLFVDAPYRDVSRFGIDWKLSGRVGVLSMTVAALDGRTDTHVIGNIAPLNLLSIARALQSHGVPMDDPEALAEAERAWAETRDGTAARRRVLDRAAMTTPEFDRALWLLLVSSAATFYLTPFGVPVEVLVITPLTCFACGYASGTPSSIAYLAPLNLLLVPTFFVTAASDVVVTMLVLSAVAMIALLAGAGLRGLVDRRREERAGEPPSARPEPARGSLRYALSGLGLVRLSTGMLAVMLVLVAASAAAGFELTTLRLAVDEVTVKQLPVDGRSNLTGNSASLTYTPGPGLREFVTDEDWGAGPNDGARWELRSSFTKGQNELTLAHYIFDDPRLDNPAAIADFLAEKDDEHSRIAGFRVKHTERVVDGRTGYVWTHGNRHGYWHYAVWFPHPVHSIRVECIAKSEASRFQRLCEEALGSLEFH